MVNVCYIKMNKGLLFFKQQNKRALPKCGFGSHNQVSLYLNFLGLIEICIWKEWQLPSPGIISGFLLRGQTDPVHRKIPLLPMLVSLEFSHHLSRAVFWLPLSVILGVDTALELK